MERHAEDRHRLNNAIGTTLVTVGSKILDAETALSGLRIEVAGVTQTLKDLTSRLVGDERMRLPGITGELATLKDAVEKGFRDGDVRFSSIAQQCEDNRQDFNRFRWMTAGAFTVLVGLGGVLAWLQASFGLFFKVVPAP